MSDPIKQGTPHPFTVELEDGTVIGGAKTEADAVVLVAGAVTVVRGMLVVRDTNSGDITAQIGRDKLEPTPVPEAGPRLTGINPASSAPGLPPQVLICVGSGFIEGCEILWGDVPQATTFDNDTEVSTRLGLVEGTSGEQVSVQVLNPDGNVSETIYFLWE